MKKLMLLYFIMVAIGLGVAISTSKNENMVLDEKIIEEFNPARVLKYDELKRHLKLGLKPDNVMAGTVEQVVDTDTIKVLLPGEDVSTSVKMLLIDCPREGELFGEIATNYIKKILAVGSTIYIERDIIEKDLQDKQMGYIWYESAGQIKLLNEELVKEGLAKSENIYKAERHIDIIREAEYDAIASKKNIWSVEGYVTNNGFDSNILK